MRLSVDPTSAAGKAPVAERHVPLIVIGAGQAGLAAACAARDAGIETLLIDENPVSSSLMGLDVPLHFGQRMTAEVQNKARMVEYLVNTNPALAAAFERGVDVQMGVYVWGALVNGPSPRSVRAPLLGLADETRSWAVSFDRLIVATGARDLGMGFAGWEKPGVMGAQAAAMLLGRYGAFGGRRLVVMGTGATGLELARLALDTGIAVAGIVDVAAEVSGPNSLRDALLSRGVKFHLGHAVKEARGATEVDGVVLVRLDANDGVIAGSETVIDCDTVVMALGVVPNIELLDILGCRLEFRSEDGGHVPVLDDDGRTSIPTVYAVGDCAAAFDTKSLDPAVSIAEGGRAGVAAARSFGVAPVATPRGEPRRVGRREMHSHWQHWLRAEIAASGWDVMICQCEEVTRRELVDLRPPRYLQWGSSQMAACSLTKLAADGPLNQDQVKRLTRAGMGLCQGRRCREQVQMLLAAAGNTQIGDIPLASYRPPLRPLALGVLAATDEPATTSDNWVVWFNIPSQWTPHWQPAPLSASLPSADAVAEISGK